MGSRCRVKGLRSELKQGPQTDFGQASQARIREDGHALASLAFPAPAIPLTLWSGLSHDGGRVHSGASLRV